jgi:hypothetical protein
MLASAPVSVQRVAPGGVASQCDEGCLPDGTEFAEKVEELFGADGVAEVLDKERSGGLLAGGSYGFDRDRGRDDHLPVHFGCEAGIPAHSLASGFLGRLVGLGGAW